jgi:tetratricopeptide (TPR) repeat protein
MIFVIILIASLLVFSPVSNAISIPMGSIAPKFTLISVKGKSITLSEFKGRTIVLVYWRTGQKRSLLSLKDTRDVVQRLKQKDVELFSIIAGSDDTEEAKKILLQNKIEYPLLIDAERNLYSDYGVRVYPTTIIVDKDGIMAKDIPSHPLTYKKLLEGYIRKALGEIDEAELENMLNVKRERRDESLLQATRFYNLAMKFTKAEMLDQAIGAAAKSIEVKPDMEKSHILLGFLYLEIKEPDSAFQQFSKALEITPSSKESKTGLGAALIMKGEIDEALKILEPAVVANPYPQMTYYELGRAYELKGDKDKSNEMYKKALEKILHKKILPSSFVKCQ